MILSAVIMADRRRFDISPKHDNAWLVAHKTWGYNFDMAIADDIIKNAMELDGRLAWGEVIQRYTCKHGGKEYSGKPAVAFSISKTFGFSVIRLGLGMSSPEAVYMSGNHYARSLGGALASLNDRVEKIGNGEVEFKDDDEKDKTIQEAETTMGRLGTFKARLSESLGEYAEQYLPQDESLLAVLKVIPYFNKRRMDVKDRERYAMLDSLRAGDIATAHRIVLAHQPKQQPQQSN
jgi:hypothetical protein